MDLERGGLVTPLPGAIRFCFERFAKLDGGTSKQTTLIRQRLFSELVVSWNPSGVYDSRLTLAHWITQGNSRGLPTVFQQQLPVFFLFFSDVVRTLKPHDGG